ncbi:MAG: pseudaminic acid cytidylyltransferase [Lachnospiraceae bacterium]|jgi:pseudaminic acid cytidylyltransferase|nr:pseudaminic acid cytidylyltransferase [Lachnospiraceae bacterium]MEE3460571.1 pseudaminic acid cytidylyltransferase [Lachnospiraceae bacterium]
MSGIAIITARGGSKRIPKKNIRDFCGRPIIAYSIEAAVNSGIFDEVMVSTDSEEIADISRKYGAKVPFMRSEKTAGDFATTADVIFEVLNEYKKLGMAFDWMACLYPTAPFVTAEKLKEAYRIFKESGAEELEPVVPYSFPPQRCFVKDETGTFVQYKYKQYIKSRSQDLEKMYHDAGQFYFIDIAAYTDSILNHGELGGYDLKIAPLILDDLEVQDIDNETDWKLAEMKYKLMAEKNA